MSEPKYPIHIRIRDLRRQRSLTQEELAGALGISRQSINAMEAGRCLPSLPVALQIATYFSVPLTTVLSTEGPDGETQTFVQTVTNPRDNSLNMLTPWSPLREMREALDGLMDETIAINSLPQMTLPAANVYQIGQSIFVEMCLPGYEKEQLSLEVGEDFLTVSAEGINEYDDEREYVRREFAPQRFSRTVALPALVVTDTAKAEMKKGILTVQLPKIVEERPKTSRISISMGE